MDQHIAEKNVALEENRGVTPESSNCWPCALFLSANKAHYRGSKLCFATLYPSTSTTASLPFRSAAS